MSSGQALAGASSSTPADLTRLLRDLIANDIRSSLMIWGPPGVGKSSIVSAVAKDAKLQLTDVRLSQLAPTDLRGLPVPRDGTMTWYPPDFLPRSGRGILFLDEINMAPPTMQGIAQQLILDRRIGSYAVPEGWFVWAAGNRKEDKASVFDMPAPLANRFLHVSVNPHFDSFRDYALRHNIHEHVLAFLSFRPALLHSVSKNEPAWPSPRSWAMASRLHQAGLDIAPAVGSPVAVEFSAFVRLYQTLPDLDAIISGKSDARFPDEPSGRFAITVGLTVRCSPAAKPSAEAIRRAGLWLARHAPAEWLQLFLSDLIRLSRPSSEDMRRLQPMLKEPALRDAVATIRELLIQ
jgi:MoxR-like ATPase